jgi:hypothetical protein
LLTKSEAIIQSFPLTLARFGWDFEVELPYSSSTIAPPRFRVFDLLENRPIATIWSNDYHIAPIANMKRQLPEARFIDKSLSRHCQSTNTCAANLKVLTYDNGIAPSAATQAAFVSAYKDDPEFATVDIVVCFHPSAMCELFMPLKKRLFVIATTRYEMGRHSPRAWAAWNSNLRAIASNPRNVVAANNLYDAEYIRYFTGLRPVVLPSFAPVSASYQPTSSDILIAETHSPRAAALLEQVGKVSPRLVPLREKYPRYSYEELCSNTAILYLPYQTSVMSLFEQYGMGIPILVPTPEFLWELHNRFNVVCERTWDAVRLGRRPSRSAVRGASGFDPNNDLDRAAFLHWIGYADYYQWPHIIQFSSFADLKAKIQGAKWSQISSYMRDYWHKSLATTKETLHRLITRNGTRG